MILSVETSPTVSELTDEKDQGRPLLYNKKYSMQLKVFIELAELKSPSRIPLPCNLQKNDTWLCKKRKMHAAEKISQD